MPRRNFATVDALLALTCVVIFAGGVLAQTGSSGQSAPPRGGPPVEQIASDLGIPADRVREAFRKVGPPPHAEQQQPTEAQMKSHAQALAQAMNVSPDKLLPVLEKYRPAAPPAGGSRGSSPGSNPGARSGDRS
jgi:hypothetical protein